DRDLPPKKTRQLIYALYALDAEETEDDWLLNYIDADSVPPHDHLLAGVAGVVARDGPHVLGRDALSAPERPRPPPLLGARQGALLPRPGPDRPGQLQPLGHHRGPGGGHAPVDERAPPR